VAACGLTDQVDDTRQVRGAEDAVDLGHRLEDVTAIALGEAAGDDERATGALFLELRELQDGVDRLLAGAVDEGARVDDEALGVLGPLGERESGLGQHAEHQLGVDLVLGTAEGGQVNLHGPGQYTGATRSDSS